MDQETLNSGIILHELANVVMVIQTGAHIMADEEATPQQVYQGRMMMIKGTARLTETISALRVLLGRSEEMPKAVETSVAKLSTDIATDTSNWLGFSHKINVATDHEKPELIVPGLFRLVMRNFMANALKYSPKGSVIDIRIRHSAKETRVLVRNRGNKIPDAVRACLFEPGRKTPSGGSGHGVHIAQLAAKAMRGRINFVSQTKYTAFCLVIPTRRKGEDNSNCAA